MKKIQVQKVKDWKAIEKSLRLQAVPKPNCPLITEDTIAYEDGKPILGYYIIKDDSRELIQALKRIRYAVTERTGGLPTRSRIFGCTPRIVIRKDFCSRCELTYEEPKADALVKAWGVKSQEYYQRTAPEVFAFHQKQMDSVLPDWRMGRSPWTQGIINWNNQLRFHKDSGNFPDTWSLMLSFNQDIEGGWLYFPRYNIALECGNSSVITFNGQDILHGVTPIRRLSPKAYRYTIVYYSLNQMSKCLSLKGELDRIKKVKTERERKRANV